MCTYSKTGTYRILDKELTCYKVVKLKHPLTHNARVVSFAIETEIHRNNKIPQWDVDKPAGRTKLNEIANDYPYEIDKQGYHMFYTKKDAEEYFYAVKGWHLYHGRSFETPMVIAECNIPAGTAVFEGITVIPDTNSSNLQTIKILPSIVCSEYSMPNYGDLPNLVVYFNDKC